MSSFTNSSRVLKFVFDLTYNTSVQLIKLRVSGSPTFSSCLCSSAAGGTVNMAIKHQTNRPANSISGRSATPGINTGGNRDSLSFTSEPKAGAGFQAFRKSSAMYHSQRIFNEESSSPGHQLRFFTSFRMAGRTLSRQAVDSGSGAAMTHDTPVT